MNGLDPVEQVTASPYVDISPEDTNKNFSYWADAMSEGQFQFDWQINNQSNRLWPSAHRLWREEAVPGKTAIVRSKHGLGDTIQMLQYASQLQAASSSVIYAGLSPVVRGAIAATFVRQSGNARCPLSREQAL